MKNLLFLLLLVGCSLKIGYKQNYFWVEPGDHDFKPLRVLQTSYRTLSFDAMFRDNCIYNFNNENQRDINKLYGITSASIHQNSARFGWRAEADSTIGIFAYWYVNGNRGFQRIGETKPSIYNYYSVKVKDNKYVFQFNDSYHIVNGVDKSFWLNSYRSYPWFGGNEVAPHLMEVIINER